MSVDGPHPPEETRTVVVAAPDADEARSIGEAIERLGLKVFRVGSAEELRLLMQNLVPHLAVLDHALPDATAFEVAREIREEPRTRSLSLLVLLPPHGTTVEETFISGVNDFLSRPLDAEQIARKADRLTKVADRRRLNTLALVRPDGDAASFLGRAINVSPSGLLVEIEAGLSIGSVCEVRFNLPGQSEPVRARGMVRRRAPEVGPEAEGFGIEFVTLAPEDLGRLNRFFGESGASRR